MTFRKTLAYTLASLASIALVGCNTYNSRPLQQRAVQNTIADVRQMAESKLESLTREIPLTTPRVIEKHLSEADVVTGEDFPTYSFKLIDLIAPEDKTRANNYDVLVIGSSLLHPELVPDENSPEGYPFKQSHPALDLYMSPTFAEQYNQNSELRRMLAEQIHIPGASRIHVLTNQQAGDLNGNFQLTGEKYLPYEHFREAVARPGYLLMELMRQPNFSTQLPSFVEELLKKYNQ